jgi:putative flippase GtrA
MNRNEFIQRIIRYLLFGLLAFIALFAGSKAVTEANCSSCPGKGICTGKSDCSIFLPE